MHKTCLTIAGSDNSGGAGIQADLKVFSAFNVYGMSVITALTAQNTEGVKEVYTIPDSFVYTQIETIYKDINVDAVKTGMLAEKEIVKTVVRAVKDFHIKNLVVDTVFKSKNNKDLLSEDAIDVFVSDLLPLATVIMPNIPEAETIADMQIKSLDDMKEATKRIHSINKKYVVLKGGHLPFDDKTIDTIYDGREFLLLEYPLVKTKNTHGTGCTYSAAVTANLAKGIDPIKSIRIAKAYLHGAIENALNLGKGNGPLNHNWTR